jgi:hypothetical protein
MTMELGHEFTLAYAFQWDAPISEMTQQSITTYGSDEDRLRLAGHFSVSAASLDALAQVASTEARIAVAYHPATSLESLARLARDHTRAVRVAANSTINHLPADERAEVRAMIESPMQKFKSRRARSHAG